MNDGKYFSFSTTVMNAPCYIPFESMLFFSGELAEQAHMASDQVCIHPSYLKVVMS